MAKRKTLIAGSFIARPRQLVDSPVMLVLSQAAFRALNRIESEHMAHGGAENGKLPSRMPTSYAQASTPTRSPRQFENFKRLG
jgi:hypothetical protein